MTPALMQRRLRGGPSAERETAQKIIMMVISIEFVGLLVVPALDLVVVTTAGYYDSLTQYSLPWEIFRQYAVRSVRDGQ